MWNEDRGFGFISDDSGGPDVFLHATALEAAGIDQNNIKRGDPFAFDFEVARDGS